MSLPRLLVLSLGGTITMVPGEGRGIAPKLGAADLVAAVPALAGLAEIEARSPLRLPSPSLSLEDLLAVARDIDAGFQAGFDGAVVVQGTDTIEESAFLLDVLVPGDKPVVVTGAMRGAGAAGADGPANLLAAVQVAVSSQAQGLGTLVVLNDEIHAARFVQKAHTALTSAFSSLSGGPLGLVAEGRPHFYARVPRLPCLDMTAGAPVPVALFRVAMGEDGRFLRSVPGLGYAGLVLEGMGAGHVPAGMAPLLEWIAQEVPVVLATRVASGPVFTGTYGYAGAEIDLIDKGLVPAGFLTGLKARLLLALVLRSGTGLRPDDAFAPYR
ncbi:MAG: asparaginase [Azospirillum brasilense]|uniref:L-asparaginase n=1 Tax=Roseomonas gilardii TaxID=257708 RepID=A0A1L7ALX0_9PROT|nr:asparaginase [Roseomonas gilardii]APT59798.1 L-asparaginase [Roseomonas gilardii]PZR13413.1 MAG: asparaginase [Azospirillum brasilense]